MGAAQKDALQPSLARLHEAQMLESQHCIRSHALLPSVAYQSDPLRKVVCMGAAEVEGGFSVPMEQAEGDSA